MTSEMSLDHLPRRDETRRVTDTANPLAERQCTSRSSSFDSNKRALSRAPLSFPKLRPASSESCFMIVFPSYVGSRQTRVLRAKLLRIPSTSNSQDSEARSFYRRGFCSRALAGRASQKKTFKQTKCGSIKSGGPHWMHRPKHSIASAVRDQSRGLVGWSALRR